MLNDDKQDRMQPSPADRVTGHLDDWEDLAIDYLDGQVDQDTKAAIAAHLESCDACASRLGVQHAVCNLLEQTSLEAPPTDLEDRVLGEILFPRQPAPVASRPAADKPSWWSMSWQRRFKAWIPATVAVVALLAAVISYGVVRGDQNSTMPTVTMTTVAPGVATAQAPITEAAADGSGENYSAAKAAAPGGVTSTTTGATTTAGAATTAAGAVTTTVNALAALNPTTSGVHTDAGAAAAGPTTTSPGFAARTSVTIQDKELMVSELKSAGSPVYFVFEPTAPATGEEAATQTTADFAQLITQFTGLQPLDESLSLLRTTFAAYVPRDQGSQLVDLLRSIGATLQLTVNMALAPVETTQAGTGDEFAALLRQHAAEIPEMHASRTPQPAVTDWTFTTSTLSPANQASAPPDWEAPDQAGAHVLIVIYLGA